MDAVQKVRSHKEVVVTLNGDTSKALPNAGFVKGADVSHLLQLEDF